MHTTQHQNRPTQDPEVIQQTTSVVQQFWAIYNSSFWIPNSLQDLCRSPSQIAAAHINAIHFLAEGERLICFSHLFTKAGIAHKLCLAVSKMFFKPAVLEAGIELRFGEDKLLFRSGPDGEILTRKLLTLGGTIKEILTVDPPIDLDINFYAPFNYDPSTQYHRGPFSAIDPTLMLRGIIRDSTDQNYGRSKSMRSNGEVKIRLVS